VTNRHVSRALLEGTWAAHGVLNPEFSERGAVALPKYVSHYTDGVGALGIIGKRELWATDALFMNDETELRFARPILEEAWDERSEHFLPNAMARRAFWDAFIGSHDEMDLDPHVHVVCFCQDGDLLSQWRGYGAPGGGYSLQFKTRPLYESAQADASLSFVRVTYAPDRQRGLANRYLDAGTKPLREWQSIDTKTLVEAAGALGKGLGRMAISFAMRVKDQAFAEENEWRLVYQPAPEVPQSIYLHREFRARGAGIIPFVRIGAGSTAFRVRGLEPTSVTVGPSGNQAVAKRAVEYLLRDFAFPDVPVHTSRIPLRA
jgi:hypothetical protein